MKNKGFTLVEFLISISIIIILTSVSFWGYNRRQMELNLQKDVSNLLVRAEEIKEKAISSMYFHDQLPDGGYGIYIDRADPKHYVLFADCNGNLQFDSVGNYCNGYPELIERMELTRKIYIKELSSNRFHITFMPPSPDVTIMTESGVVPESYVVLGIEDPPQKEKRVNFNSAGLIYVE